MTIGTYALEADVAPARERGLKFRHEQGDIWYTGRSREGAWIEMGTQGDITLRSNVAPARERGLK